MRLAVLLALTMTLGAGMIFSQGRSADGGSGPSPLQFQQTVIPLDSGLGQVTSITFGPDGRLYAAWTNFSNSGIVALTLDGSGRKLVATEEIASGLQYVLGLAFDPTAPPGAPVLYASRQEPNDPYNLRGRVSVFSGPGWDRTDMITGLPSDSGALHLTNGLAFDQDGRLLVAQGAQTEAGGLGYASPLAGAILVADVHDPSFDGDVAYEPPGPPQSNDVDQASGDVHVFASGLRNPYDLVVHTNGRTYATDNAGSGPASVSCTDASGSTDLSDELNLIEEGLYYGHPNRNRGRFNPDECVYRSPREPSEGRYRAPIAIMPAGSSCNGIVEYTSDAFDGEMNGDLLCVGYFSGELRRAVPSNDGCSVLAVETIASGLSSALDVATSYDGTIYVAGAPGAIYVLSPTVPSTASTPTHPAPRPAPCTPPSPALVSGDANCDFTVNAIDAALMLQFGAALIPSVPCPAEADVNRDGSINSIDAALVLQYVAGLLGHLPP